MRMKMQARKDSPMLGNHKPVTRIDFGEHYPDGGWGWTVLVATTVVYILCHGFHYAFSTLMIQIIDGNRSHLPVDIGVVDAVWLGSIGISITLALSPVITTICRRKSPRLYAVIGGLIVSLGCLFLSFSTQKSHVFVSYCVVLSVGSGITVNTANIMIGRYFKNRRALAESIMLSGTGAGAAFIAFLIDELIRKLEWAKAMQSIAGTLAVTMIAGALYRSASLYHPRRNVILHIKTQKKCRHERDQDKPPYFDFTALKMRALQGIMVISAIIALGMHVPYVLLLQSAKNKGIPNDSLVVLNVFLGLGYAMGCYVFGYIVIRNSSECAISRLHLTQACALTCGVSTLVFVMAKDYHSFALYAWLYGLSSGGYFYTIKMYAYSVLKERIMERGWSIVNAAQFLSFLLGPSLAIFLNRSYESDTACYVFAGVVMIFGGIMLYFMPLFERHSSTQDIIQLYQSACSKNTTEAAALLDLDLTNAMVTKPLNNVQFIVSPSRLKHSNQGTDSSKIQMQCFIQHSSKEKPKQIILSRITEEREGLRLDFNEISCISANSKSCSDNSFCLKSASEKDLSLPVRENRCHENTPDNTAMHHIEKTSKGSHLSKLDSKFRQSSDNVKLEFFDPPSQEKESTATVSYDSDLYINLCEAQV